MNAQAALPIALIAVSPLLGAIAAATAAGLLRLRDFDRPSRGLEIALASACTLAVAALAAFAWAGFVSDPLYCAWAATGIFLAVTLSLCDVAHRVIPWSVCAALALAGIAFQWAENGWGFALSGACFGLSAGVACAVLLLILPPGWLGGGDVHALAGVVAYFGVGPILGALPLAASAAISSGIALAVLIALFAMKKIRRRDTLPFGPFFSVWVVIGAITPAATLAFG